MKAPRIEGTGKAGPCPFLFIFFMERENAFEWRYHTTGHTVVMTAASPEEESTSDKWTVL